MKKNTPKKSKRKSKKKGSFMKKFLITLLLLIIIIGVGAYLILTNINTIVKFAIEKYGSEVTQTTVRVKGVDIKLKEGSGAIEGLTVGNPKGFETPNAFSLGKIGVKINIKSILEDVKIVDEIIIRAPKVFVEVNKEKQVNLNELSNNIAESAPSESSEKSEPASAVEPKLKIGLVRFSAASISAKVVPLNKNYELNLPSFTLRNLGGKNGGTPTEITRQILGELAKRALAEVRKKGIATGVEQIKKRIIESQKENLKEKVKGLFGR